MRQTWIVRRRREDRAAGRGQVPVSCANSSVDFEWQLQMSGRRTGNGLALDPDNDATMAWQSFHTRAQDRASPLDRSIHGNRPEV